MHWIDLILIAWLGLSAFSGFRLGFLYKIISLIGTIVGIWFATRYTGAIAIWFGNNLVATLLTFLFLISLISHLAGLLAWFADKLLGIAKWIPFVGLSNRIAGAIVSVLITAMIMSVGLWIGDSLSQGGALSQAIAGSTIASIARQCSLLFLPLVADTLKTLLPS